MGNPNAYLYGGMVRHLVAPTIHTDYGDIDVSAASDSVIEESTSRFGYTFRENATSENDPRYFLGKSGRAGKPIQLLLMRTQADALKFIHNAQYGMDRTAYSNHQCWGDPQVGESATLNAIKTKQVRLIPGGPGSVPVPFGTEPERAETSIQAVRLS